MQNILFPLLALLPMAWIVHRLFRESFSLFDKRRLFVGRPTLTHEQVRELIRQHGRNSNSFMLLYPGFEYFASERPDLPGAIAFVDTSSAWVGGAQPLCGQSDTVEMLDDFARTAARIGKSAMMLPVSQSIAEQSEKAGYQSILIGSEPVFQFDLYPPSGKSWLD